MEVRFAIPDGYPEEHPGVSFVSAEPYVAARIPDFTTELTAFIAENLGSSCLFEMVGAGV